VGNKEVKKGAIVRYVGVQCPSWAGLEGEVVWADDVRVEVKVLGGSILGCWAHELKVLRGYSKSFLKSACRRVAAEYALSSSYKRV